MATHMKGQEHAEYLKGDSWKCSSSPTGAHHWMMGSKTICKYCLTVKQPEAPQPDSDPGTPSAVR